MLRTGGTARSPACQTKELPWPRPSALPGTVSLRRTHIIRRTAHQCNRPAWVFWAYRSSTCTVNRCTGMPPPGTRTVPGAHFGGLWGAFRRWALLGAGLRQPRRHPPCRTPHPRHQWRPVRWQPVRGPRLGLRPMRPPAFGPSLCWWRC